MVKPIIDLLHKFRDLDANADFELTPDESKVAFDEGIDENKDGKITIKEWAKSHNCDFCFQVAVFEGDLLRRASKAFEKIGIMDNYLILEYLITSDKILEYSIVSDGQLGEQASLISALISMGFSQEEALHLAAKKVSYAFQENITDDLKIFFKRLPKFGVNSASAKRAIIADILKKNPNYVLNDRLGRLQAVADIFHLSDAQKRDLFLFDCHHFYEIPRRWFVPVFDKDIRSSLNFAFGENGLKKLLLRAVKTNDMRVFHILTPNVGKAIAAMRKYGANSETVKDILLQVGKMRRGYKYMMDGIPDILNAFSKMKYKAEEKPIYEFLMWLNSTEMGYDSKDISLIFNTLPMEIDWLNKTIKDPKAIYSIVSHAFLAPFSLVSFHKLWDVFTSHGVTVSNEDLLKFIGTMHTKNGFDVFALSSTVESLEVIQNLNVSKKKKKEFMETVLALSAFSFVPNHSQELMELRLVITNLKYGGFNDKDIFDIATSAVFSQNPYPPVEFVSVIARMLKKAGTLNSHALTSHIKTLMESGEQATFKTLSASPILYKPHLISTADFKKIRRAFPVDSNEFGEFLLFLSNIYREKGALHLNDNLDRYISLCKHANKDLGIRHYGRYLPNILESALSGKVGDKHAFIITPRNDWNGAFYSLKDDLSLVVKAGYTIDIVEAGNENEIYARLKKYPAGSINLMFINGHGFPGGIVLDIKQGEAHRIDLTDDEWKKYLNVMEKKGRILFASCSTGKGEKNIARNFLSWSPQSEVRVIAPPKDISSKLTTDKDGNIGIQYTSYPSGKLVDGVKMSKSEK